MFITNVFVYHEEILISCVIIGELLIIEVDIVKDAFHLSNR